MVVTLGKSVLEMVVTLVHCALLNKEEDVAESGSKSPKVKVLVWCRRVTEWRTRYSPPPPPTPQHPQESSNW